ncbi:hypothetical protein LSH36_281g05001 [Paralvinella palmiformis]|uniref:Uncharacterized protein n=1 Tax=Paralvinella palmiformis TaxID=53620 RepID=A0AAD9N3R4_9ANNE|nr:hypothetical protein LSH36_281g05001 [Paralvinella palmiformis]
MKSGTTVDRIDKREILDFEFIVTSKRAKTPPPIGNSGAPAHPETFFRRHDAIDVIPFRSLPRARIDPPPPSADPGIAIRANVSGFGTSSGVDRAADRTLAAISSHGSKVSLRKLLLNGSSLIIIIIIHKREILMVYCSPCSTERPVGTGRRCACANRNPLSIGRFDTRCVECRPLLARAALTDFTRLRHPGSGTKPRKHNSPKANKK